MSVLLGGTVVAKTPDPCGDISVVRGDRTAVADGAEVLRWIEAPRCCPPEPTCRPVPVVGAVRLGGIFEDLEVVPGGDVEDGIDVGRLSVEVHGNDGPGSPRDRGFDEIDVEV